jgi:ubiquinol-cytochrome c reductase iron-sulfur subunit
VSPTRRDERLVFAALVVAMLGAVAFAITFVVGWQNQWGGAFLAVALGGLGAALVWWGHRLLREPTAVQEREPLASDPAERRAALDAFDADQVLERRPALRRMLLLAGAAVGAAAVFPFRSLGPRPHRTHPWHDGVELVDASGDPVHLADLPTGGLLTAFPRGHTSDPDGPVVVVRVDEALIHSSPERRDWSPDGLLAYSKICTHAGCPVGLYQAQSHTLLCPCHQSLFDVLHEARPISGPASSPLPQLPLRVRSNGGVVAAGDLSAPPGPAGWSNP